MNSLKGGVVPRVGLGYIAVGREKEIDALLHDIEIVQNGELRLGLLLADTEVERAFSFRPSGIMPWIEGLWLWMRTCLLKEDSQVHRSRVLQPTGNL